MGERILHFTSHVSEWGPVKRRDLYEDYRGLIFDTHNGAIHDHVCYIDIGVVNIIVMSIFACNVGNSIKHDRIGRFCC